MNTLSQTKPFKWLTGITLVLITAFTMAACQKENKPVVQEEETTETVTATTERQLCYPVFDYQIGRRSFDCRWGYSFCRTFRWKCIPLYFEWPPKWWDIYDVWKLRDEIRQFGKIPDLTGKILDPEKQFSVFPINSQVVVLQFYSKKQGMLNGEKLIIEEKFDLDEELASEFKLKGFNVPAGSYPVVYDAEHKTYNAIVNVR